MFWPWQRSQRERDVARRIANAVVRIEAANDLVLSLPRVACVVPDVIELLPSQQYAWCRCGLSADGLWCDGSHLSKVKRAALEDALTLMPLLFSPPRKQHVWLCTCKQSRTPPYCDASHHRLVAPLSSAR